MSFEVPKEQSKEFALFIEAIRAALLHLPDVDFVGVLWTKEGEIDYHLGMIGRDHALDKVGLFKYALDTGMGPLRRYIICDCGCGGYHGKEEEGEGQDERPEEG